MHAPTKSKRGISLVELLVYMALLSLALSTIYAFFHLGMRYLHKTRTLVEVEQAANVTTFWLMKDLMETSAGKIASFPNGGTERVGIVFLSARDANYDYHYDDTDAGDPKWQRYVGYYLDTDPEHPNDSSVKALYRGEVTAAEVSGLTLDSIDAEDPVTAGVTTDVVRSQGTNIRLIAHGIKAPAGGDHGGFNVYSSTDQGTTKTYGTLSNPIYLDLEFLNTTSNTNSIQAKLVIRARS